MRRTVIRSEQLGEEYIRLEHESGLHILLYPMKGFRTAYAIFGTDYGSIDNEFRLEGEESFQKVPDGIAHYLEHKLFESEDGDAFASAFCKDGRVPWLTQGLLSTLVEEILVHADGSLTLRLRFRAPEPGPLEDAHPRVGQG